MKKLVSLFLLTLTTLCANETTVADVQAFNVLSYKSSCDSCCLPNPFGVFAEVEYILPATVPTGSTNLRYGEGQIEALFGFKPDEHSGITVNVGAGDVNVRWRNNTFFNTQNFGMINLGISGYTDSICRWLWLGGINAQYSANDYVDNRWTEAARYGMVLWGRYAATPLVGLHFGVLVFTGIMKTNAYPIIGVDFPVGCNWQFNLVFPTNLSIYYNFAEYWYLALAGRPFITRQRLGWNEPLASGVFEYRNYGTELSLNFDYKKRCEFSLFGGYSFGGTVKFENAAGNTAGYRVFRAAPYFGTNILFTF